MDLGEVCLAAWDTYGRVVESYKFHKDALNCAKSVQTELSSYVGIPGKCGYFPDKVTFPFIYS